MRIGLSRAWVLAMAQMQPPAEPPLPVVVTALIDTGAAATIINPNVVDSLGLRPVGAESVISATSTAPSDYAAYAVDLMFPEGVTVADTRVICLPLLRQNIQCLIGRDILERCVLVYIGHLNQYTLSL
jgi:predicted aspartyl protease